MTNPKRVLIYILSYIDEFDDIICLNANCRCDFIVLLFLGKLFWECGC